VKQLLNKNLGDIPNHVGANERDRESQEENSSLSPPNQTEDPGASDKRETNQRTHLFPNSIGKRSKMSPTKRPVKGSQWCQSSMI